MDKIQLADLIKSIDNDLVITEGKHFTEVSVPPSKLHSLGLKLKEHEKARFDFLFCITGVDYKQDLGIVYHLRSTVHGHTLVIKIRIPERIDPQIDSVADIWKTAEFHEREIYDLLGIRFNNHPDLRRLFLDKTWGFPLRKDYVDEVNIVTK